MTEKEFKIKVLPLSSLVFPMAKRLLVSEEAARDAVQVSMIKLWENRSKLDECESVKAFVFRVVRNTCLDEIKRKKPIVFEDIGQYKQLNTTYNLFYDEKESVELVKKIISELPKGQKEVIQLRDIDGLEFNEITEILNTDLAYIRVLLSRARKSVKQKLEKIYAYEAVKQK